MMRITFEEVGSNIVYRVSDFDPKYEPVLQSCFYENDGRGYTKMYPKDAKYINRFQKRYAEKAQLMFDQLGYFAPVPWEKGLEEFCRIIQGSDIEWWLTGSCAACIRGIPLNPHDVDIMINSKDVQKLTELFADYLTEPIVDTKGWVTKDFGVMFIDVRIDIASDPQAILDEPEPVDCGPYAKEHLETVEWRGYAIKVPPLKLQINVNKKRGRMDRVKTMEEFLRKSGGE